MGLASLARHPPRLHPSSFCLIVGSLELIVLLALVRLGENAYGMTVRREIEARTGRDISIGAVYATLERLEAKGYVRSQLVP